MSQIQRVFSGAPWETDVAYCRALRRGDRIFVSGTAPVDAEGRVVAPGNGYGQARCCFKRIQAALQEVGADLEHVVRTRMFVTDISRWQDYAQAHREVFEEYPPVTTMVEVRSLITPEMLIEVEAEAIVI